MEMFYQSLLELTLVCCLCVDPFSKCISGVQITRLFFGRNRPSHFKIFHAPEVHDWKMTEDEDLDCNWCAEDIFLLELVDNVKYSARG